MNQIIKQKLTDLKELCEIYKVKSMYAFGSVCSPKFNNDSDLDFLIKFKDISFEDYANNYFDLRYKLEQLFNRPIDLLTENSLSNPYFIKSVEETKTLIYGD